jgi:hypothetical protein
MKYSILVLGMAFATSVSAQTIKSVDNRVAKLPSQFIVTPSGIKWIQPGLREPTHITWDRINLEALAREEPKIEEARQTAALTNKDVFVSVPPPRNYYKEFLAIPINTAFKEKWEAATTSRSSYQVNTSGFVDSFGNISASSNVSGVSNSVTQYIDKTRPSLNTNMAGLLLKMSADSDIDTHRLVNDLRESGSVYYNVKSAFGNLQAAYPGDIEISRTVAAMDRLMAEKTTSVDAMRQLKKFVEHARSRK